MQDKDFLHVRISRDMLELVEKLVSKGLFSNKNEVIRESIRTILLKYKEEVGR